MTHVLIVDDHAVTRAGYRQFLERDPSITAVCDAGTAREALDRLRAEPFDVVLLDLQIPDARGLDVLRLIRQDHPEVQILIVSGLPEMLYARESIRAGASGYLSKSSVPEELLKAIHILASKRRYVSESLAELLASDLDGDPNVPLHVRLSPREFQIFNKLAVGQGVSMIGQELGLSVKTISTYRSRIMQKMTLTSNANMTAYALRYGLIE